MITAHMTESCLWVAPRGSSLIKPKIGDNPFVVLIQYAMLKLDRHPCLTRKSSTTLLVNVFGQKIGHAGRNDERSGENLRAIQTAHHCVQIERFSLHAIALMRHAIALMRHTITLMRHAIALRRHAIASCTNECPHRRFHCMLLHE